MGEDCHWTTPSPVPPGSCLPSSTSSPTSPADFALTDADVRDSKDKLCRGEEDEILGYVEKEQGEVVGSQMAEQVNTRGGVFQHAVSPSIDQPFDDMGLRAAGLKLLALGTVLTV